MSRRSIWTSAAKWNCCGGCGRLADENRYTVVVVTHELNLAAEFSDRIALLHKGKCLRIGAPAEVYQQEVLEEVFEAPLEVEMRSSGRPRVILTRQPLVFYCSKRRARNFHGAVHNHQRLRAREDGEKPSPPRDCKAEFFSAHHCPKRPESPARLAGDSQCRMGRPRCCPDFIAEWMSR